jgi:acyl-CoA thioesterase-1
LVSPVTSINGGGREFSGMQDQSEEGLRSTERAFRIAGFSAFNTVRAIRRFCALFCRSARALMLAALLGPGLLASSSAHSATKNVLVLGDSLSAEYGLPRGTGWVSLLDKQLRAEKISFGVVNASISGETTAGGKTRLPALLEQHKPAIVILELGGNDGLRGLSLAATQSNLREMITASTASGARVLLVGMRLPPNYGVDYSKRFAAMYQGLGREKSVKLVPFMLEGLEDTEQYFQPDRIHPNQKAQPIMLDNIWPALRTLLK